MNKEWWLAEGVIVKSGIHLYEVCKSVVSGELAFKDGYGFYPLDELLIYTLIGTPFDCIPKWAEKIKFWEMEDGTVMIEFISNSKDTKYRNKIFNFSKCPKKWIGKTFLITKKLKELI